MERKDKIITKDKYPLFLDKVRYKVQYRLDPIGTTMVVASAILPFIVGFLVMYVILLKYVGV